MPEIHRRVLACDEPAKGVADEFAMNAIAALGIRLQLIVDARWITLEDLASVLGTTTVQSIEEIKAGTLRLPR